MFDYLSSYPITAPAAEFNASVAGPPAATSSRPSREMTFDEVSELTRPPQPARRPASEFAHLTNPDELALELNSSLHLIDLRCPEIQRLIESTEGSLQGAFLARRLAPNTSVGTPRPIRRKRLPKGKQPILPNLFSLANELAAAQASDED